MASSKDHAKSSPPDPEPPRDKPIPPVVIAELTAGQRATMTGWAVAAAFTLIAVIFYLLRYILIPFTVAAALAYVAAPVVRALRHRLRVPRWVAAVIVYCGYLVIFVGIGLSVRYLVLPNVVAFVKSAPANFERLIGMVSHGGKIQIFGQTLNADEITHRVVEQLSQMAKDPGHLIFAVTTGVAGIIGMFLTLVLLAYFLIEGPRLTTGCLWLVPPRFRARAQALALDVAPIIYSYIRGVLVIVAYAVVVTWLVTHFILHLPHSMLLAISVGLLEMIPVVGPILSLLLVGLVAIEQATIGLIIGFALFAIALRLSIDQLVGPLVLGRAVELPPTMIIFAFLAGGALFGVIGVLLAIPFVAAVKIILTDLYGDDTRTLAGEDGGKGMEKRG